MAESTRPKRPRDHLDQIELISLIFRHLGRFDHNPMADPNVVVRAANAILGEYAREANPAQPGMGLAAWFAGDDTGLSSRALAALLGPLVGQEWARDAVRAADRAHTPADSADFGRCVRLLDAVPGLREHLPRMAEVSPTWARLVGRWDELERLFRSAAPGRWSVPCNRLLDELRTSPRPERSAP